MKILRLFLVLVLFLSFNELTAQCLSGDCVNGKGKFKYPSGGIYEGDFLNGEIHGIGKLTYPDGRVYIGYWVHRYQEGRGRMTMPDGREFLGFWKQGEFYGDDINGEPIALNKDPKIEEQIPEPQTGCIAGDCNDGEGKMLYADGGRYTGEFKNGKINGYGTFIYTDSSMYVGWWKDGYYNGEGTMYVNNPRDIRIGLWQEGEYLGVKGEPVKKGCTGNCNNGEGTFVYEDGSRYIGDFIDGLREGQGTLFYNDGSRYTGGWIKDKQHGYGITYFPDGTTIKGNYRNGQYFGEVDYTNLNEVSPVLPMTKYDPDMKIYAVVVGVAEYSNMRPLKYTDDDAYKVNIHLARPEGGALPKEQLAILINEDATKDNILNKMEEIFAKADSNDMVMLYFSGHGAPGYFCPIDINGSLNRLYHEEVNAIFNKSQAKFKLCIADACHAGSLFGLTSKSVEGVNSTIANYYNEFNKVHGGIALLLSSKGHQKSWEYKILRQSVFTHYLLQGLEGDADIDNNSVVTIKELFNHVHDNVVKETGYNQTPVLYGDYDEKTPVSVVR